MPYLNDVTIVGHLGRDAETDPVGSATKTRFSVAVERSWRPKGSDEWKRETDWINVVGWSLSDYVRGGLTKGACVLVKGSIRTDSYEAKDGSGKRYNTYVHADKVQLFKPKDGAKAGAGSFGDEGGSQIDDDSIPF